METQSVRINKAPGTDSIRIEINKKRGQLLINKLYKCSTIANRCTYLLALESTKIYIKIYTKLH